MISAVFFDLDDTLYDQLLPFKLAFERADLNKGIPIDLQLEHLYKRIRRHSDRLWEQHAGGHLTLEELRIARTTAAFADMGVKISAEEALHLQLCYEQEQLRITLRPGVIQLFDKLLQLDVPFGIITNGPVLHQMNKIESLELLSRVDASLIHISDGIGIAKPNPEVFHYVQRQVNRLPEQLLYVGDAWHNDIVPSYQAGWTPMWFNARKQLPQSEEFHIRYLECLSVEEVSEQLVKLCSSNTTNG